MIDTFIFRVIAVVVEFPTASAITLLVCLATILRAYIWVLNGGIYYAKYPLAKAADEAAKREYEKSLINTKDH